MFSAMSGVLLVVAVARAAVVRSRCMSAIAAATATMATMTSQTKCASIVPRDPPNPSEIRMHEKPLPKLPGLAILRDNYYRPSALKSTLSWARSRLLGAMTVWERAYLNDEICRIEAALARVSS